MSGNQVWVSEASNVDGVSGETILGMLAAGNSPDQYSMLDMFIGSIPGSIAETSTLMVLIGAFILIYQIRKLENNGRFINWSCFDRIPF